MPIRFRTQDTRASTRRKLNALFELEGEAQFRAPTPTMGEWRIKLNEIVRAMIDGGYEFDNVPLFRTDDTRQMMCRKLNWLAVAYEAGPSEPEPDPEG